MASLPVFVRTGYSEQWLVWVAAVGDAEPRIMSGRQLLGDNEAYLAVIAERVHASYQRGVRWVGEHAVSVDVHAAVTQHLLQLLRNAPPPQPCTMPGKGRGRKRLLALIASHGDTCHWCGRKLVVGGTGAAMATIEHLTPRSKGGADALWNLRPACRECNSRRGNVEEK